MGRYDLDGIGSGDWIGWDNYWGSLVGERHDGGGTRSRGVCCLFNLCRSFALVCYLLVTQHPPEFLFSRPLQLNSLKTTRSIRKIDKMLTQLFTSVVALATVVTAHFSIEYPEMRGDSFATGASQWIYPCTFPLLAFPSPIPFSN